MGDPQFTLFLFFKITFWLFNIAMENGPFIVDLPINNMSFSMAMLNNHRVSPSMGMSEYSWSLSGAHPLKETSQGSSQA